MNPFVLTAKALEITYLGLERKCHPKTQAACVVQRPCVSKPRPTRSALSGCGLGHRSEARTATLRSAWAGEDGKHASALLGESEGGGIMGM